jgi:YD repeat-containing protein
VNVPLSVANALGEVKKFTDPNGTVHQYTYDVLGRMTVDDVTTLGTGVDGRVIRQAVTYATGGQVAVLDSTDSSANGIAQVSWTYNGLGDQATQTTRSHFTGGVGSVNFAYGFNASGTENHSRLTSMTYPGNRVVTYDYGTSGSVNDKISRINAIKDGTTTLEQYSYLGLSTVVERDRPQPQTKLTFIAQGSGDVASDSGAGDPYVGLDRFGRVVDQRWRKYSTPASDLDRFQYTYDRNSNRKTRAVRATGAPTNLDEAYTYDALDRLTKANRGTLAVRRSTSPTPPPSTSRRGRSTPRETGRRSSPTPTAAARAAPPPRPGRTTAATGSPASRA